MPQVPGQCVDGLHHRRFPRFPGPVCTAALHCQTSSTAHTHLLVGEGTELLSGDLDLKLFREFLETSAEVLQPGETGERPMKVREVLYSSQHDTGKWHYLLGRGMSS